MSIEVDKQNNGYKMLTYSLSKLKFWDYWYHLTYY